MNEGNSKEHEILEEFANRLIKYYRTLKGDTNGYAVAYHIEQVKKELLEEDDKCKDMLQKK
jgi:hypothetical protein